MTYLTESRDALAKALHERLHRGCFRQGPCIGPSKTDNEDADALIASGAVIAVDTLADAAKRVQDYLDSELQPSERDGRYDVGCNDDVPLWSDDLHALAAALTERGDQP